MWLYVVDGKSTAALIYKALTEREGVSYPALHASQLVLIEEVVPAAGPLRCEVSLARLIVSALTSLHRNLATRSR